MKTTGYICVKIRYSLPKVMEPRVYRCCMIAGVPKVFKFFPKTALEIQKSMLGPMRSIKSAIVSVGYDPGVLNIVGQVIFEPHLATLSVTPRSERMT